MKFRKHGVPDPTALDLMREVQPMEFAKRSPLRRLDYLLGIIKKNKPKALTNFVINLQQRYEDLVEKDLVKKKAIDISSLIANFDLLKEFPKLASSNLNYYLHVLQPPEDADWDNETLEVSQRNELRAFLCPKYQNLLALTKTIDREEAIELYKIYHDKLMIEIKSQQEDRFESLQELATQWNEEDAKKNPGLVRVISNVEDGKLFLRKDTCLWNDALEDLEDLELKYYVCCYGDYQSIKHVNKHFVMTMAHTIVEGHAYCDCVFHDTRINKEINHPPKEFFENIELSS
ncbi:MAG: L-2-amino-thiazoline-4-carboxylic acid hydrolase [Candidatus Thorarchaeota archaeon]|jgi:hypothetical protein